MATLPLPSHLPDLCLSNIFKRVPLRDLLRSGRLVCSNWNRVVPTELKRRRSVVLVQDYTKDVDKIRDDEYLLGNYLMEYVRREDGSPWLPPLGPLDQIYFDALLVPGGMLSDKFASSLMDTLPVISNLTVVQLQYNALSFSAISSLQQMIRLINNYANSLVSLKIHFDSDDLTVTLLDSINQLESLQHLTLNGSLSRLVNTPRLTILSRLKTFTSEYYNIFIIDGPMLMDSIRQFANGNIRIHCVMRLSSQEIFSIDPQLAAIFISIYFNDVLNVDQYDNMRQFGARFTSLTRLSLTSNQIPMTMLARCLSPLTQLIELKVAFIDVPQDEVPQPELKQVAAVRLLLLFIDTSAHFDTERLHLAELFPNVQVLRLYHTFVHCTECGFDDIEPMIGPNTNTEERGRIEQCLSLARVPFRACPNLHTIKLSGTAEHFLPDGLHLHCSGLVNCTIH